MFQDCEENIFSLNDLMVDKPLIIFQSTVDCGYCFAEAPAMSDDIIKYRDKINFAFFLTPHNINPRCSGKDAGDHDWPDDWRNRYLGYKGIPISIQGIDYFMLNCEVTTSYGILDPRTNTIIGGSCKNDGKKSAIAAALKLIADGVYTSFATSVAKPQITISGSGNIRNVAITSPTSGADIYYTTDGSTPSKNSAKYNGSIQISQSRLVKAVAMKSSMNHSPVTIKYADINNTSLVNISKDGTGYEWTSLTTDLSNSNRKVFPAVNDGKMVDAKTNNGAEEKNNHYQAVGVVWDAPKTFSSVKFTHHSIQSGNDGRVYLGFGMKLQTTQDGTTWANVDGMGHFPEYPYGSQQRAMNMNPIVFFGDKAMTARGVRLVGQLAISGVNWGGTPKRFGLQEFEVFKDNSVTSTLTGNEVMGLSIYPNPAQQVVNFQISSDYVNSDLTISDALGRVVKTQILNNTTNQVNVSDLAKGVYLVNVRSNSSSTHEQLIIE